MNIQIEEKDVEQFLSALRFAAEKHRDQRRKDTAHSPYINHPIAVAETLWRIGRVRDMVTLTAALLHDTVEDTGTSPEEISTRFGDEVRGLVMEVTDDKRLPKARRKELQVETAPHKSARAKQIKLADKINNVIDITYTPPIDWSEERQRDYLDWTERVVNGLRGQNPQLEAEYDRSLAEGRALLKKT
ncbi:MAG: bifunctional (p)ppGpp synthetase/guanosine-3',5'-bis(diphosphate) 3'-pyrophosphohydrolase [Anaerolineaceae bacterium]|nr:bifunctional (p)ppGpp synthetase/guanosine-3',5'-bis(diphosphate) 3'-pyrophosphohydrolase [Anaerolineaceae bacterium]